MHSIGLQSYTDFKCLYLFQTDDAKLNQIWNSQKSDAGAASTGDSLHFTAVQQNGSFSPSIQGIQADVGSIRARTNTSQSMEPNFEKTSEPSKASPAVMSIFQQLNVRHFLLIIIFERKEMRLRSRTLTLKASSNTPLNKGIKTVEEIEREMMMTSAKSRNASTVNGIGSNRMKRDGVSGICADLLNVHLF